METVSRRDFLSSSAAVALAGSAAAQQPKPDNPVKVPARAVTRGPRHHWFGYYDKTPWDRTGRYLLANEVGFVERQPKAGDTVAVGMVDLKNNDEFIPLAETAAWSWQQGAMLQWLGS